MDLLITCAVFLLLTGVGAMLINRQGDRAAVSDRLDEVSRSAAVIDPLARQGPPSRAAGALFERLPRFVPMRRLEQKMWQAGMYQGVQQILLVMIGLLAAGVGLGIFVAQDTLIAIGLGLGFAVLAEIYNWFTEGFDTRDLKDAKALLDELNE